MRPALCQFRLVMLAAVFGVVALPAAAQPQPATACHAMMERWQAIASIPLEEWRAHPVGEFRGEARDLDDSAWETVKLRHEWEGTSMWLRRWVEIPAERNGYDLRGSRWVVRVYFTGDFPVHRFVYVDGLERTHSLLSEPVMISESAAPGQRVLVAVRAQVPAGKLRLTLARLEMADAPGRPGVQSFVEECVAAESVNAGSGAGQQERARRINAATAAVDWSALERGDNARFDESIIAARAQLEPLREWLKSYTVYGVGNSHIDMAWLWPWTETVEVVRNTFTSVLQLMQEYPDFKFTHSSVQTYAWMEEKYPALFEAIRRRVREGRWEIVGGMWVEPDLNMPDGESLARQLLVGKRYIRERFGVDVRIGYNPDSFGYNWQLPQIYKKSGVDFFVTQKLGWNDTTPHPHKLFWWESPDGSRVLTYLPRDYVNAMDPLRMARDLGEHSAATGMPRLLYLYGVGDHGGGPTRAMLDRARSLQQPSRIFPQIQLTTAQSFFDAVAADAPKRKIPAWQDELYLQYHRGVLTTQAHTKRNNRRSETLVLNAEKFASLAHLFGRVYPQEALEQAWRKVLFNQFHDILPGSSIPAVYVDAERDYAEVRRVGNEVLSGALGELALRIRTEGPGAPVIVFNPLAWTRSEIVEAEFVLPPASRAVEVRAPDGQPAIAQVAGRDEAAHRWKIGFLAEDVPSLGYKVFHVVPVAQPREISATLVARPGVLENEFLRLTVDGKTGCITSLYDKRSGREALAAGACGNLLQAFRDKPRDWDAWNIDANFEDEKWDLTEAEEVKLTETGPLRAVLRVRKHFRNSRFTQDITLYPKTPRVDVVMTADWHEDHTLLKVAFPLAVKTEKATFEIPYGSIERPTTRRTPEEKAKFEVPALRWADLSEASHGFSLLNDSKYGYDAKDNVLRLTLLRSPKWPDPDADRGRHEFTYALYPHAGTWREGGTVRRGYELNTPLVAVVTTPHSGMLPPAHSFFEIGQENVVLTAIKKAEDDEALIVRYYEFAGREGDVELRQPPGAVRAWLANLQEQPGRELPVRGGRVSVPTKPYEIQTLKIDFSTPVR
jgi:alpha-mannosidase